MLRGMMVVLAASTMGGIFLVGSAGAVEDAPPAPPAEHERELRGTGQRMTEQVERMVREIVELHQSGDHERGRELEEALHERFRRVEERIHQLAAHGRVHQAEQLERHARGLQEMARRHIRPRMDRVAEELEREVEMIRREIEELHAQGRHEEAEQRELEALEEGHRRSFELLEIGFDDQAEWVNELVVDLADRLIDRWYEDGRDDDAEVLEEMLDEHLRSFEHAHRDRRHHPEFEDFESRIHHLWEAAENLDAAGLGEQADMVRERAEAMERELEHRRMEMERRERERGRAPQPPRGPDPRVEIVLDEVRALRHEVRELRELVEELYEEIEELEDEIEDDDDD